MASDRLSSATPRVLLAAVFGTAAFGAGMALAHGTTRQAFSLLFYGDGGAIDAFGAAAVAYITFMHAVLGAVMVGWAVALFGVLRGWPALKVVAASVGSWFVFDSTLSLALGFWQNAVLNVGFAALFGAGLWAARGDVARSPPIRPGVTQEPPI